MITVLGIWEPTWMEPRVERRVWSQTIVSFEIDTWAMAGGDKPKWTIPAHYSEIGDMVDCYPGRKTFLIAEGRTDSVSLPDYQHPEDAIYVFGNTPNNLVRLVRDMDDVVSIPTPYNATMFAHCALPIVLYDRMVKRVV